MLEEAVRRRHEESCLHFSPKSTLLRFWGGVPERITRNAL